MQKILLKCNKKSIISHKSHKFGFLSFSFMKKIISVTPIIGSIRSIFLHIFYIKKEYILGNFHQVHCQKICPNLKQIKLFNGFSFYYGEIFKQYVVYNSCKSIITIVETRWKQEGIKKSSWIYQADLLNGLVRKFCACVFNFFYKILEHKKIIYLQVCQYGFSGAKFCKCVIRFTLFL